LDFEVPAPAAVTAAEALQRWVGLQCSRPTPESVEAVRRAFKNAEAASFDYDLHGEAFAVAFHLINFWKVYYAILDARPAPRRSIVDLGAGTGSAACAALVYLHDTDFDTGNQVEVVLVDKSAHQLHLSKSAVHVVADALKLSVHVTTHNIDVLDFAFASQAGIVLAAHSMTENSLAVEGYFSLAGNIVEPGGCLLVVERADDPIWVQLTQTVGKFSTHRRSGTARVPAGLPSAWSARHWFAKWILLESTSHTSLADTVTRYFEVWRSRDPTRLSEVFRSDALYYDKADRAPMKGLDEIVKYWKREVEPQNSLVTEIQDIKFDCHSAVLLWRAQFERAGESFRLRGWMSLEFDHESALVSSLREWYIRECDE
jgi:SAM-dependent methyltransferase